MPGIIPLGRYGRGQSLTPGAAVHCDGHHPFLNTPVGPPGGRSAAPPSIATASILYITVSPPSGGTGGLWSTSFSAFSTSRASGQPPATPRRAGWPSRRKVTNRLEGQ